VTAQTVMTLGQNALTVIVLISAPLLLTGLGVGLIIGIFQTVTSIQETTLAYIPKMLAVVCVFILCLPWISRTLVSYTAELLINLPQYAR